MHGRAIIFIEIKAGLIIHKFYNSIVTDFRSLSCHKINIDRLEKMHSLKGTVIQSFLMAALTKDKLAIVFPKLRAQLTN